jgi:hypothetical protein
MDWPRNQNTSFQVGLAAFGFEPSGRHAEMKSGKRWHRIGPMLLLLAFVAGTLCTFSTIGYCVGRNTDTDLRFLEPRRAPTVDEAVIAYPIEYSLRSDEKNDVIFLGDSTCRCGIDPASFERLTGLRAYNLGSQGRAGAMAFVLTARAYLSNHPAPRIIVFDVSPVVWDLTDDWHDGRMQVRFLSNYGPEVPGVIPRHESLLYFVKRGSLAVVAAPSTLIAGRTADVRGLPLVGFETETYRSLEQRTRESRGFGRFPGLHTAKIRNANDVGIERRGKPVTIPDDWTRGVRLLAETCQSQRIPLLIRLSPMPKQCEKMRDFSPVEKWAEDLQSSCPQLIVGRPILLWYDFDLCWDPFHLNTLGVAKYTPVIATEVRAALEKRAL